MKFHEQDLINFINENEDQLKVEYIDFKYSIINPQNLIGIDEFNQEFFDKIDQIENDILNGNYFNAIISEFDLSEKIVKIINILENSHEIEKKFII